MEIWGLGDCEDGGSIVCGSSRKQAVGVVDILHGMSSKRGSSRSRLARRWSPFLVPGSCSWRKKALDSHATLGLHTYTGPGPGQAGSAVQALGSLTGTDEAAVGQIDEARIATATSVLPTIC